MKIKIEVNGTTLCEYMRHRIAKEMVRILKDEAGELHTVESMECMLKDASLWKLIKCWTRLVWPKTKPHLSQYQQRRRD